MKLSLALLVAACDALIAPPAPKRTRQLRAVAAPQDSYKITLLPGDGIGPEITTATVKALVAAGKTKGVTFDFDEQLLGGCAIDAAGTPWPDKTLESCKAADSILMAAIGGPKWDGNPRELRPETGLLAMRQQLGLRVNHIVLAPSNTSIVGINTRGLAKIHISAQLAHDHDVHTLNHLSFE